LDVIAAMREMVGPNIGVQLEAQRIWRRPGP
jgi:hypothetical protein